MSERTAGTGGCLCGAVRIAADLPDGAIQACHCRQCQRWTGGGPLFSVRVENLRVEGEDAVAVYRASAWGERAFCGRCGTTLWWRMQGRPRGFVAAGLLDDQSALTLREEIFVDHRAPWIDAWPDARQSTEAQELAALHDFLAREAAEGAP